MLFYLFLVTVRPVIHTVASFSALAFDLLLINSSFSLIKSEVV